MNKPNPIKDKSLRFALNCVQLYKLLNAKNEYVLSKQFVRSSTSIGANINEAQAAFSKKDFIYKMSIASKEARETDYWLELIEKSNFIDYDFTQLKNELNNIKYMLTAIVKTSQQNLKSLN